MVENVNQQNQMKKTLTATLPNIGTISRTTEANYTHVIFCPAYVAGEGAERTSYAGEISWASSLELAEKVASQMGFHKVFCPTRRKWNRKGGQQIKPVIVPVNA